MADVDALLNFIEGKQSVKKDDKKAEKKARQKQRKVILQIFKWFLFCLHFLCLYLSFTVDFFYLRVFVYICCFGWHVFFCLHFYCVNNVYLNF